jgi:8-oxo-dGTP pyrophosphatase MutT (NUDIX family)
MVIYPLRARAGGVQGLSIFAGRLLEALFLWAKSGPSSRARGAAALVLDGNGRVLLVRHGYQPGWRLPGGGIERGETAEAAVRRELAEEVGMQGGRTTLMGEYRRRVLWVDQAVTLFRVEGAAIAFRPGWEIREILWADPALPPPGLSPATARRLAELRGAPLSERW